jgi:hypothetical protein
VKRNPYWIGCQVVKNAGGWLENCGIGVVQIGGPGATHVKVLWHDGSMTDEAATDLEHPTLGQSWDWSVATAEFKIAPAGCDL